jgi:dihydrofolate reductase
MLKSIIVAVAKNGVIGKDNRLPWHLPADLRYFKTMTTGHTILMGRKNYESIGRPLPNRINIILTTNKAYRAEGCIVVNNIADAVAIAHENQETELFVCGGAMLYELLLPHCDKLYYTHIDAVIEGDVYFPAWDHTQWNLCNELYRPKDEKNGYDMWFREYEKIAQ